jgi:hypothetical protein
MSSLNVSARRSDSLHLKCDACGNSDRFIEIMKSESHLVDGRLNYLHLLEAQTDRYLCAECGQEVEARSVQEATSPAR